MKERKELRMNFEFVAWETVKTISLIKLENKSRIK